MTEKTATFPSATEVPKKEIQQFPYFGYAQIVTDTEEEARRAWEDMSKMGDSSPAISAETRQIREDAGKKIALDVFRRADNIALLRDELHSEEMSPEVMIGKKDAFLTSILLGMKVVGVRDQALYFPNVAVTVAKDPVEQYHEFSANLLTATITDPLHPDHSQIIASRIRALVPHVAHATGSEATSQTFGKDILRLIKPIPVEEASDDFIYRKFLELEAVERAILETQDRDRVSQILFPLKALLIRELAVEWRRRKGPGKKENNNVDLKLAKLTTFDERIDSDMLEFSMEYAGERFSSRIQAPWVGEKKDRKTNLIRALGNTTYDSIRYFSSGN